ncbi:glutaredoxin domain-containing protein [Citrobacter sp. Marseille-Q6884]|uniref:glutaredoxin domain-containing protein n=1 Tax=Citrobacter sp. Marseille-Q6884 TaxID=2956786 RepID=UPI001A1F2B26|nr:glutaredoxin domain-containing protein [Citrobacter sp. Marseille-Q6884]EMF0719391.1 thioredoxin family protein [Citrobacter freundii]EMF0720978.1 thioredoxin family protein [Citrobacter freundii]MBJ3590512.1 thioredoxin family protein [Salmonella enterica subsp. enterica serovar Saintpaul]
MTTARFYHAGCPVCVSAEEALLQYLSPEVKIDVIHLGEQPDRVTEAELAGVKSVPALVIDGNVLHINFGASIDALK